MCVIQNCVFLLWCRFLLADPIDKWNYSISSKRVHIFATFIVVFEFQSPNWRKEHSELHDDKTVTKMEFWGIPFKPRSWWSCKGIKSCYFSASLPWAFAWTWLPVGFCLMLSSRLNFVTSFRLDSLDHTAVLFSFVSAASYGPESYAQVSRSGYFNSVGCLAVTRPFILWYWGFEEQVLSVC